MKKKSKKVNLPVAAKVDRKNLHKVLMRCKYRVEKKSDRFLYVGKRKGDEE